MDKTAADFYAKQMAGSQAQGLSYASQVPGSLTEPPRSFADQAACAEMLASRAADLCNHVERIEARLIGHGAAPDAAGNSYGKDTPKAVESHFVTTRDALSTIERRIAGAMASLNRLADAVGVDRA